MSDRPLKVLSICTSDSSGGAARAAYRIHKAVVELGVDSRMFVKHKCTDDPEVLAVDDFIPHNVLYKGFDWMRNKIKNKWQHYQWGKYPEREKYFVSDLRSTDIGNALKEIEYDILHLHWINLRFFPLDQLPKNKPVIWTLHDSWPFCGICHVPLACKGYTKECGSCPMLHSNDPYDLSHKVWRRKKGYFDSLDLHVVAPSHWMADCARSSSLFKDRDIRVIPNCIDTYSFSPGERVTACEQLNLDADKRHILFAAMSATSDPNKGMHYLLDAISRLSQRIKENTDLIILGAKDNLEGLVPGIPTRNLGILYDENGMIAAYRAADLTVVPSLSENLSCTIMESLSCGTPVTAFRIGGNEDLIVHQSNGYLAREKDSMDLATGIAWCLENNVDGQLSVNGRESVLNQFTPAMTAREYTKLYSALKG